MTTRPTGEADAERTYLQELIERIVRECPRRQGTSDDELRAQEILEHELANEGLTTTREPFTFNDSLYANLAVHNALAVAGTLVSPFSPAAALAAHALAAGSYWADSTRRGYLLRRVFPWKPSRNIVATAPAKGTPRLRLVFTAHADAAFTGLLFDPAFIKMFSHGISAKLPFMRRFLALTTTSQAALAGLDLLRCILGPLTWPLRPVEWALTAPSLLALFANLQIVLKDTVVPGANDDLSGCAALPLLAARLLSGKPDDVELVFVVTGCEECSLGGADALARSKSVEWDRDRTVVIGLDGLSGPNLRFMEVDSELDERRVPQWLADAVRRAAAERPRFTHIEGFRPPVGGTDIGAFLAHGYAGVCFTSFDPAIDAPPNYHMPTDTPDNLNYDQIIFAVDFVEALGRSLMNNPRFAVHETACEPRSEEGTSP